MCCKYYIFKKDTSSETENAPKKKLKVKEQKVKEQKVTKKDDKKVKKGGSKSKESLISKYLEQGSTIDI